MSPYVGISLDVILPPVKKKIQQISNFNYNANHRELLLVWSLCKFSYRSVALPTHEELLCCVLIRPTLTNLADGHFGPVFFNQDSVYEWRYMYMYIFGLLCR